MAILESAAFWIIVAAASEIIALSPLKDNSIIQLVLHTLKTIKPGKKIWTSLGMDSGYGDLTPGLSGTGSIGLFKIRNFTQRYLISLIKPRKNGWKASQRLKVLGK